MKPDIPLPDGDTHAAWIADWHPEAIRCPSPNFGPRPEQRGPTDLIVIHSISLPPGTYGGRCVQQLFTNQLDWTEHPYFATIQGLEVSSHFYIERGGQLWQFVGCDDRAWHAGQSSYRGRTQCNDDSIGVELEGLEGDLFTDVQYAKLAALCRDIASRYPIAYVAGHEHIAPGRKKDPGPGFDWQRLQRTLAWPLGFFPDGIVKNALKTARNC